MAQSYLDSKSDREMETIGREYFENLAARSFFQDFEKDAEGNIVRCKMHDIVHDFAQFLTNNECLIVEDDCENLKTNLSLQKGRHATLIQFKYLRAMDLRGNDTIVELPREVGEFIHLRYLNLSRCRALKTLPETICGLCNLQTLDEFSERISLPKGVGRLTSLRTLPFLLLVLMKTPPRFDITFHNTEDAREDEKVAEALQPHPNLKSLSIVEYQHLPPLGELPLLEYLNIQYMWRVKYVVGNLGSKEEGRKVMPCLLSLKISASPKLATLPDLLQRTPPLDLSFKYCNILQGSGLGCLKLQQEYDWYVKC
ncbi:hypothetical protein AAG906_018007 [Vitis piasezkii]